MHIKDFLTVLSVEQCGKLHPGKDGIISFIYVMKLGEMAVWEKH